MGWKNVKEHYGIKHYVCITKKGMCIGSGYVHDLILITDTDKPRDWRADQNRKRQDIGCNLSILRSEYVGRGEPFDGIVKAMADDSQTLRRMIDTPDTFTASIPVYTFDYDGNIIEKRCEELGWPNVTHDGDMMYENQFFADRAECVAKAKRELAAALESEREYLAREEAEIAKSRERFSSFEAALERLNA